MFLVLMGKTEGATWEFACGDASLPRVYLGTTFTSTPSAPSFLTDLSHSKVKIKPVHNPVISFDFWSEDMITLRAGGMT